MIRKYAMRRSIAAVLIAGIAFAAYVAARQAISDFFVQSASLEIASWSQPGRKFRGDEFLRAGKSIDRSLQTAPASAWALEERGALQLREMQNATDPQVAMAAARASYVNFRKSLLQRPTSPFAWANVAMAKLYLGEIDDELFYALARSAEMGPWEPQPQLRALFVGFGVWNKASVPQREMILAIRDRAMTRNAEQVIELARRFDRLDLVCDKMTLKSGKPCPRAPA